MECNCEQGASLRWKWLQRCLWAEKAPWTIQGPIALYGPGCLSVPPWPYGPQGGRKAKVCADVGAGIGTGVGAEVDADADAEVDVDVGADVEAGVNADVGEGVGADVGVEVCADVGAGIGVGIGAKVERPKGSGLWTGVEGAIQWGADVHVWGGARSDEDTTQYIRMGGSIGDDQGDQTSVRCVLIPLVVYGIWVGGQRIMKCDAFRSMICFYCDEHSRAKPNLKIDLFSINGGVYFVKAYGVVPTLHHGKTVTSDPVTRRSRDGQEAVTRR